ncbi:hypothetical protein PIB30_052488 [Stylosanthes scabra]|uniref:Uncharacterized protein n=1 Tax=Stylosanthes scabra TaxID=79078 RepID=A0ABU6SI36_9FABA|nr:hypothetical protein [Stylosanthes scabra]
MMRNHQPEGLARLDVQRHNTLREERRQLNVNARLRPSRRHLTDCPMVITLQVMICLEFGGHRRLVRFLRVPRPVSTLEA